MDTPIGGLLLIQVILIAVNAFFAAAEIAVVSLSETKLRHKAEEGDKKSQKLLTMMLEPSGFLSTIQIAITLIGVITGAIGAQTFSHYLVDLLVKVPFLKGIAQPLSVLLISSLITYFSLVIGELIPKRIATNNPEKIAMTMCGPIKVLSRIFLPVVRILSFSTEAGIKLIGIRENEESQVSEDEIKVMIEQGKQDGVLRLGKIGPDLVQPAAEGIQIMFIAVFTEVDQFKRYTVCVCQVSGQIVTIVRYSLYIIFHQGIR